MQEYLLRTLPSFAIQELCVKPQSLSLISISICNRGYTSFRLESSFCRPTVRPLLRTWWTLAKRTEANGLVAQGCFTARSCSTHSILDVRPPSPAYCLQTWAHITVGAVCVQVRVGNFHTVRFNSRIWHIALPIGLIPMSWASKKCKRNNEEQPAEID